MSCLFESRFIEILSEKKAPSLSIKRGEKLPVNRGGGLTAKGRAKYNRATGSHLKACLLYTSDAADE